MTNSHGQQRQSMLKRESRNTTNIMKRTKWKRYVYVRDVQGNIRAVVGENNAVAEQTGYYPEKMKSLKFFIILLVMLAAATCATAAEMVGSPNDGSFKGVLVDSFDMPFGLFTTGCLIDRYPYDLKQAPMFFRQEKLPDNISQINVVIVGATDKKIYLDHYLQIHIWIKYKNNKKERLYSGPFYLTQAKLFKPSMPNGFKGEILKKRITIYKEFDSHRQESENIRKLLETAAERTKRPFGT